MGKGAELCVKEPCDSSRLMLFKMKVKDSTACRDFASIWRAAWGEGKKDERMRNESAHLIHEPGDYSDYGGPRQSSTLTRHTTHLGASPSSTLESTNSAETLQTEISPIRLESCNLGFFFKMGSIDPT